MLNKIIFIFTKHITKHIPSFFIYSRCILYLYILDVFYKRKNLKKLKGEKILKLKEVLIIYM